MLKNGKFWGKNGGFWVKIKKMEVNGKKIA